MTVSFQDLSQLGFSPSHHITLDQDGLPRFSALKGVKPSTAPAVYLWLGHVAGSEAGDVLYVGKAGKGVARRSAQHQGGFVNSGAGRKNSAALAEVLGDAQMSVTVMTRDAETTDLFGQRVSLYAAEEDALCALLQPRLNRAAFPEVAATNKTQLSKDMAKVQESTTNRGMIEDIINSRLHVQDQGTLDDMLGQFEAYSSEEMTLLGKMLEFVETRLLVPEHVLKLGGGYNNQIKGCDNVTNLGFGKLATKKFSPNSWIARIFLTNPPRLALPLSVLNPAAKELVMTAKDSFSPYDITALFKNPADYISEETLR